MDACVADKSFGACADSVRTGVALPGLYRSATQALTIYVHIPFCIQKCGYCDFNAYLFRRDSAQLYISALRREIEHSASVEPWTGYHVPSVYFGGGAHPLPWRPPTSSASSG